MGENSSSGPVHPDNLLNSNPILFVSRWPVRSQRGVSGPRALLRCNVPGPPESSQRTAPPAPPPVAAPQQQGGTLLLGRRWPLRSSILRSASGGDRSVAPPLPVTPGAADAAREGPAEGGRRRRGSFSTAESGLGPRRGGSELRPAAQEVPGAGPGSRAPPRPPRKGASRQGNFHPELSARQLPAV